MEGKIALEEHFSTAMNNSHWDAKGVPVYLHPREPLPSQTRAIRGYPELVGSAWAFTYETASHDIRLMLSGLFDAFPNLRVILGHLEAEGLARIPDRIDVIEAAAVPTVTMTGSNWRNSPLADDSLEFSL